MSEVGKYEHKGIQIEFNPASGNFLAVLEGKRIQFPSLAAAKKRIDALKVFVPFQALFVDYGEAKEITVTGIDRAKGKRSWSNRDMWICSDGRRRRDLYPLSAKSALDEHYKLREEIRKQKAALDEVVTQSECNLPAVITPEAA